MYAIYKNVITLFNKNILYNYTTCTKSETLRHGIMGRGAITMLVEEFSTGTLVEVLFCLMEGFVFKTSHCSSVLHTLAKVIPSSVVSCNKQHHPS